MDSDISSKLWHMECTRCLQTGVTCKSKSWLRKCNKKDNGKRHQQLGWCIIRMTTVPKRFSLLGPSRQCIIICHLSHLFHSSEVPIPEMQNEIEVEVKSIQFGLLTLEHTILSDVILKGGIFWQPINDIAHATRAPIGLVTTLGWPGSVYKSDAEWRFSEFSVEMTKWPVRSRSMTPILIPVERVPARTLGTNLVILAQIRYKLSHT